MSEYEIGKEMQRVSDELGKTQMLLKNLYDLIEYNIKAKKLEEIKEKEL